MACFHCIPVPASRAKSSMLTLGRLLRIGAASTVLALAFAMHLDAGQTGRGNPLAGDGIHPVVYYYDYSNDGFTSDQIIHDRTDNTSDHDPLLNPNPYYSFLG